MRLSARCRILLPVGLVADAVLTACGPAATSRDEPDERERDERDHERDERERDERDPEEREPDEREPDEDN